MQENEIPTLINHEVVSGDNLWDIAKKYNSNVSHIREINKIKTHTIQIGWVIKIPNKIYMEKMDLTKKWNQAVEFRKKSQLMESIVLLKEIIDFNGGHDLLSKAQFQIADIYLNDINNYIFAIQEFQKVIENYPESEEAKKSLFMLGYISSNYIEAYSDALLYYNMFLDKYPLDELSYSINYELELLDSLNISKDLKNLNK